MVSVAGSFSECRDARDGVRPKAREPDPARAQTYTTNVRRLPDPTSRLLVDADGRNRLGGAVPSPAAAFLLALITLPTLFWLVTLKRTTVYTRPEQWLMNQVVPQVREWVGVDPSRPPRLAARASARSAPAGSWPPASPSWA